MILKFDNKNLPFNLETLDISSEYNIEENDKFKIDAFNIFDFNLNEEENFITIEPKSADYLEEQINHSSGKNKQLQILLKITNTKHLAVSIHNSKEKYTTQLILNMKLYLLAKKRLTQNLIISIPTLGNFPFFSITKKFKWKKLTMF